MQRKSVLNLAIILNLAVMLALALMQGSALAQPKTLKDQLVGAWTLLLVDGVKADGSQSGAYGPNPIGSVVFAPDGHYSLQIIRSNLPKIAANDPNKSTADETKAVAQGMITHFGTYEVNDADKVLSLHVEGSSFPNWDGTRQQRQITAITNEVLTWTSPVPGAAEGAVVRLDLAWKHAK